MANTESDATYCSEVEKENLSQRRRSQRLSQKLSHSFRSNGDPASQRFEDIHQMLRSNTTCNGWSKHDWLALRFEIGLIKKTLKGVARSRITFVEKKIIQGLRQSSVPLVSNVAAVVADECNDNNNGQIPSEPVKSPNILDGLTTEAFTELLPYQPPNTSIIMKAIENPSIAVTQVNPLDLTKKGLRMPSNTEFTKKSVQLESSIELKLNEKDRSLKPAPIDISKDLMVDLTDDIVVEPDRQIPAPMVETKPMSSKPAIHTSKWLKYLPTQQKPKPLPEISKAPSPSEDKPKSFKQSLIKLYKDNPTSTINIANKTRKPTLSPSKSKGGFKTSNSRCREKSNQKPLRNTESAIERTFELDQRCVQSDRMSRLSQIFFADDLIQPELIELNDGDSLTSLPFSLKDSFKKVFGTDSLDDVLGYEKVIYSLTERHVERLASALNVKNDSLKRTIDRILTDDDTHFEDDVRSGSSVVECSQSPPHRLFPSQKSQVLK